MCQSRIRQIHGKYFMHAAVRQHYVGVVGKFLPKQFQTPNFLLPSFLCIFGEWGHRGCTHAQGQVAGLCIHISVEPKIKLFTSQAEAACTTQHMGAWAPSYPKPACSLVSQLLARGTHQPLWSSCHITPAATALAWRQDFLSLPMEPVVAHRLGADPWRCAILACIYSGLP